MAQTYIEEHLHVGVGRTDVTPALGTLLTGYPDPGNNRKAQSVRDPLYATAVVLEQGDKRTAMISIDNCVIDDNFVQQIREGVEQATGIAGGHVIVCATHSHSTPRTHTTWGWGDVDDVYAQQIMVPGAIKAVKEAAGKCVPVRVGIGTCESSVGINRRGLSVKHQAMLKQLPWGLTDPTMTVLRFDSNNGTVANIVHVAAHPTVFGGQSKVISRDWPGIMVDRVEELTGAPTLFINGAIGDVAPYTNSQNATGDGDVSLWETGAAGAMDAMGVWRGIKDYRNVTLGVHVKTYELPYRALPSREEAAQGLKAAGPNKDKAGQGMCNYMHYGAVLDALDKPVQSGKAYLQSLVSIGPVVIVPFPGEPFSEISLRLRHASPFEHTLVAGASCGNNGYFWSQEQLCRGGYEPWVGRANGAYLLAENIDDALIEKNMEMLETLYAQVVPALPGG